VGIAVMLNCNNDKQGHPCAYSNDDEMVETLLADYHDCSYLCHKIVGPQLIITIWNRK
jgi:hypothetical protein